MEQFGEKRRRTKTILSLALSVILYHTTRDTPVPSRGITPRAGLFLAVREKHP
jgi:hypothetical protein